VAVQQPVQERVPEAVTEGQPRDQKVDELGHLDEGRNNKQVFFNRMAVLQCFYCGLIMF
jgi:hypothetical protein